jgi:hypothetical protein
MYLVYIRPFFEDACEVWDNCGIGYSDKLEITVEGINDEFVIESLQKGTIKLSPFRKGYIVVL